MPNKSNTKPLLSVKELTQSISASERTIQWWVDEGKISPDHVEIDRSDIGRPKTLINPMGLPEKYRLEFFRKEEDLRIESAKTTLPEFAFKVAVARIDVVRWYKYTARPTLKKEGKGKMESLQEATDMYNDGHLLPNALEELGKISHYTLRNWVKDYEDARAYGKDVLEYMAPKHGRHRKGSSVIPDWYSKEVLNRLLTPNRKNVTRVCKEINAELRMKSKEVPCSTKTVQRFVKKWRKNNEDTWVLMREGEKALNDKVMPYITRDWNLLNVGDVLIADGHTVNFDVKHPVTGKPHRPIMIVFLDGRSRYPVGVSLMPTENIDNINEALLDSILTLGKFPKAVILDNGRAFKAKHFTDSPDFANSGIAGVYEKYGIITHFTMPYHGQSKPVEPWFRSFNESFSKNLATYRGNSIDEKVPRLSRNEKLHKKLYEQVVGDWLPTISEVTDLVKHWAKEVYGREKHSGLKTGETPAEVLDHGRGGGIDPALLLDLMFKSKTVTPKRARFTLEGIVYGNQDVLTGYAGRLLVRYTRTIPDRVWMFDPDENPPAVMGVAEAIEAVHPLEKLTDGDGEIRKDYREQLKERKRLENRAKKNAEALASMNGKGITHSGHGLPDLDKIPDASPNLRVKNIESSDPQSNRDEPVIFDKAYERFEYLIKEKGGKELTDSDIRFLTHFIESGVYNGIYKSEYHDTVTQIINNHN